MQVGVELKVDVYFLAQLKLAGQPLKVRRFRDGDDLPVERSASHEVVGVRRRQSCGCRVEGLWRC